MKIIGLKVSDLYNCWENKIEKGNLMNFMKKCHCICFYFNIRKLLEIPFGINSSWYEKKYPTNSY